MTTTPNDSAEREAFEVWAKPRTPLAAFQWIPKTQRYAYEPMQFAYEAWSAALQPVPEIDHPALNADVMIVTQPVPAADVPNPGPWHDWFSKSNKSPVSGMVWVDVQYRDGVQKCGKASNYYWNHDGASDDIIAWRYAAVTPVPAKQEPTSEYSQVAPSIPQPEQTAECAGCALIRSWEKTAYQRGHQMGMAANESIALQATAALKTEQQEHLKMNRMMTEALMAAESAQQSNAPALSDEQILQIAVNYEFGKFDEDGWTGDRMDLEEGLIEFARAILAAGGKL